MNQPVYWNDRGFWTLLTWESLLGILANNRDKQWDLYNGAIWDYKYVIVCISKITQDQWVWIPPLIGNIVGVWWWIWRGYKYTYIYTYSKQQVNDLPNSIMYSNHIPIIFQSYANHIPIIFQSYSNHIPIIFQSFTYYY